MSLSDSEISTSLHHILLSDYHYDLPKERIAQHPLEERAHSQLLRYRRGEIAHLRFANISDQLPSDGMLVLNDTQVVKARMHFQRATGAKIEILLLHPHTPSEIQAALQQSETCTWECVVGNKKRWKDQETISLSYTWKGERYEVKAEWKERAHNLITFHWTHDVPFAVLLSQMAELPLPPYIQREASAEDLIQYQTVYAREKGAVAAPTAGLHFTEAVFQEIDDRQIPRQTVTLHVGAGTFLPVKTEQVADHDMHREQMVLEKEKLQKLLPYAGKYISVGTTSMRFLESLYWLGDAILRGYAPEGGQAFLVEKLAPYVKRDHLPTPSVATQAIIDYMDRRDNNRWVGETQILIMPGYTFQMCQGLITNFHMPETTLMLLVAAFVGDDWKKIYQAALDNDYRFLSYGDSSLLLPRKGNDM